jgi:hypothetical protein
VRSLGRDWSSADVYRLRLKSSFYVYPIITWACWGHHNVFRHHISSSQSSLCRGRVDPCAAASSISCSPLFLPRWAGPLSCGSLHIGDESRGSAPPTDSFRGSYQGGSPTARLQVPLACLSGYHAVECHCSQFCGGAAVNRRGSNCRRNIDMTLNKIITASAGNRTLVAQSITYSLLRVNGQELSHQQTKTKHQLEISWWLHNIILH